MLIRNIETDAKCDKASVSKTYNEKKDIEKIKEIKFFS